MCSPGSAAARGARAQVLAELAELARQARPDRGLMTASRLMQEIKDLCAFADQVEAHLARLAADLEAAGGAAEAGHASAVAFMRSACARTPAHAGGLVTLGRGLTQLPGVAGALDGGEISADAALTITRSVAQIGSEAVTVDGEPAAPVAERALLDAASRGATIGQLRELGEEMVYRADPAASEERAKKHWERRYLSFGLTLGGAGLISGACGDAASYEVLRTAAEAFGPPAGAGDSRTAAQRRMDGLVTACKIALDTGTAPNRHRAAPHVAVLVRAETIAGLPGAPPGRTGHGLMLTANQVLGLCCGARLTAIRWEDGLPLDVGRASRTEPPALRKALEARDRTCRWVGCETPGQWCTGHHIRGWGNGASTCLAEMALFCWVHHMYFIHLLGWAISGDPNGTLYFHHPTKKITLESPLPGRARGP